MRLRRRDRYIGSQPAQGVDFAGVATGMFYAHSPSQITAIGVLPPNAPVIAPPPGTGQFSLELWVQYPDAFLYNALLSKMDPTLGSNGTGVGYQAAFLTNNFLEFTALDDTGGQVDEWNLDIDATAFSYIALTVDQLNKSFYVYSGIFLPQSFSTLSLLTGTSMVNGLPLTIGFIPAADDPFLGGSDIFLGAPICRVAFYQNTVLSSAQVAAHYAANGGGYDATITAETGITSYWPLNETSGTVAHDLVGGNHGTYVGGCTLGQAGPGGSNAVLLDGSSGYVTVPDSPTLNP